MKLGNDCLSSHIRQKPHLIERLDDVFRRNVSRCRRHRRRRHCRCRRRRHRRRRR